MVELGGGKKPSPGPRAPRFADVIGQDELKEGLLAVGANDAIDGLLIQGEKGTAKSTAVRALADLLPKQTVVADCPYGCDPEAQTGQCTDCRERENPPTEQRSVPLVTVPLGATRERVVGSLSVADALGGDYEFDPGLLSRANRGVLYVDEVNLLDDHLVDVLLDAAASGVNRVERDGVSVTHPANFTLIGTMNPEEGDLRPQLRDRFALQTTVTGCVDTDDRVAIIEQALERDADRSAETADDAADSGPTPAERLRRARETVADVELPESFAERIAETCRDAGVDGHRGDIATARAARTLAALDGRQRVIESDVRRGLEFALPHRLRSQPFEQARDPDSVIDEHFDESSEEFEGESTDESESEAESDPAGEGSERDDGLGNSAAEDERPSGSSESASPDDTGQRGVDTGGDAESPDPDGSADQSTERSGEDPQPAGAEMSGDRDTPGDDEAPGDRNQTRDSSADQTDASPATPRIPGQATVEIGEARAPDPPVPDLDAEGGVGRGGSHTDGSATPDGTGSRVRTVPTSTGDAGATSNIDPGASVRAAAQRGSDAVESRDLRQSVRQERAATLVTFVVDASASMRPAMRTAKATVMALLEEAYQDRNEVAFVTFAGESADVLLPPTNSVTMAARHLKDLPSADRTPLPAGLYTAGDVVEQADPAGSLVVLVTDGRANVAQESPVGETREAARQLAALDTEVLVVDASEGDDRSGLTDVVARETDAECAPIEALSADRVATVASESQL